MSDSSDLSLLAGQAVALAEAFRDGRRTRQDAIREAAGLLSTLVTFDRSSLRWAVRELLVGLLTQASNQSAPLPFNCSYLINSVRSIQKETVAAASVSL
jgi:hypothetical protein